MAQIIRGAEDAREVVFPRSVRVVKECAFGCIWKLRQVLANEGLAEIRLRQAPWCLTTGAFDSGSLERIRLPSTLKRLERRILARCERLRRVELAEGLEEIGECCFSQCSIRHLVVPASVRKIEGEVTR